MLLKSIFNFEKIFILSKWYCLDFYLKRPKEKKESNKVKPHINQNIMLIQS